MGKGFLCEALVVGGGPAGLAAGLHLARAGYKTLLVEKGRLGGQARLLGRVENYPGFPRGIDGQALMARWAEQARRWGLRFLRAEVRGVRRGDHGFSLRLKGGRAVRAKAVIYCPGARFRSLGVPGEHLAQAAFDHARRWRGKTAAVAGGGEAAAHQALALARRARRVYLICRGGALKAHRLLLQRLAREPRVVKIFGARVSRLQGGRRLEAIEIKGRRGRLRLEAEALFVLTGKEPAPLPFPGHRLPRGFFMAGDADGRVYRQIAIASGDGMTAAMQCAAFLESACGS